MTDTILYVTFDGVLQPLAFSQVVRLIAGLRTAGFRYHLLSVERRSDLADRNKVAAVEAALGETSWTPIAVDLARSARRSAEAISRVLTSGVALVRREGITRVHARAHLGGFVAHSIRAITGAPYLFDVRGCWIEEKTYWFARPSAYALGKWMERRIYRDASAITTLTELLADDIRTGAFGAKPCPVVAIPPCADYDDFDPSLRTGRENDVVIPKNVRERLDGNLVFGIVGALNQSYAVDASLHLIQHALDANPRTHVLVLTQQMDEYANAFQKLGIASERHTLWNPPHIDMPHWLAWLDWGLLLLPDVAAKRGSMPTKLAEFFAAGVRPIAHGCNSEMMSWVRRSGSGVALETLDEESLRATATRAATIAPTLAILERARSITTDHFSLASAIRRYGDVLSNVKSG
jgi:hypothetical protein